MENDASKHKSRSKSGNLAGHGENVRWLCGFVALWLCVRNKAKTEANVEAEAFGQHLDSNTVIDHITE